MRVMSASLGVARSIPRTSAPRAPPFGVTVIVGVACSPALGAFASVARCRPAEPASYRSLLVGAGPLCPTSGERLAAPQGTCGAGARLWAGTIRRAIIRDQGAPARHPVAPEKERSGAVLG